VYTCVNHTLDGSPAIVNSANPCSFRRHFAVDRPHRLSARRGAAVHVETHRFHRSRPPSPRRKLNASRHLLERARRTAAGAALCTDLHRLHCAAHGGL
jgi:hypothetical protein